ncbi:TPMT family class I SAM-dependent methyltransferase [Undibacterium sp. Jales W-56]|uniref:TPMT family class I SAM-dependent methyltransferase n=1 Tax=Undibacterium sp. Jales W-56 TaxID=2897325 RepID=UPI0021CED23B|nr:TPMT family class I SAM-dependent methyltransferase [Undibacterium sp. Jales W-56]MCU6432282.1 TPMT family class I SAM-dependent methyltransferase [Undibacterium sp. Jales W-56]
MPDFTNKDPASTQFWDERFEQAFTPWDKGGVPQAFKEFVRQAPAPLTTLIPGCGNAYEVALLARAGWDVTAIDFSPAAVQSARAALGEWGGHVLEADFFRFIPASPLGLIYERAFFCALPPTLRNDIVARWAELLPAGALLAGFFFFDDAPDASPKGPPFSIRRQDWQHLMMSHFELIEDHEVRDSMPVFAGKERWQIWRRRSS